MVAEIETATDTLTQRQMRVAMALARRHGHEWAFAIEDEGAWFDLEDVSVREIGAYVEDVRGGMPGISAPWLVGETVYHSTGTGRTSWWVDRRGDVQININRPDGVVLRADLRNGALRILHYAQPMHDRHVYALQRAVEAALDGYGWTRQMRAEYERRFRQLRAEALPDATHMVGAGIVEYESLPTWEPVRAAWVDGDLRSSLWLPLNTSESGTEWSLVRFHQRGEHDAPVSVEAVRGFPSEAAAAAEAKRRNPATLPWAWVGPEWPNVPLAECRANLASRYGQITREDAHAQGMQFDWCSWPAVEGRAALVRIAWAGDGSLLLVVGRRGPFVREFADDLAARGWKATEADK